MKVYIAVGMFLYLGLCTLGCRGVDPFISGREDRLDEIINRDARLLKLAEICSELGSIQDFKLLRRSIAKDGSALFYYYRSSKSFPDASAEYSKFLAGNGWKLTNNSGLGRLEFYRKNGLIVDIQYGGIGDAEYGITCGGSLEA